MNQPTIKPLGQQRGPIHFGPWSITSRANFRSDKFHKDAPKPTVRGLNSKDYGRFEDGSIYRRTMRPYRGKSARRQRIRDRREQKAASK